jgi:hypothetical protein
MKTSALMAAVLATGLATQVTPRAWGQPTLTTLFTNGATSNRINMVVLSEGYTSGQLAQFLIDARGAVSNMLAVPPYQEYSNYFNAYAISVASTESGSDHYTPSVSLKNTYFNSTYDSYGLQRLLTIPPNDRDGTYTDGQGKVDALLQALMPEYDLVILLVNDPVYGGSGGATLVSSMNSASAELVRHEAGHTFGYLTDEYSSAYPGYVPSEQPNATAQTNRNLIKWGAWINAGTAIPTPQTTPYAQVVGLFEGAQYQTTGWYRPKLDCKMNHLNTNYCEVCQEQLVKVTYQRLSSIDAFAPAGSTVVAKVPQPILFSVAPLVPRTHNLALQWYADGTAVTGATNSSFSFQPQLYANGNHVVRAQVRDATALVRVDPGNVLSNSRSWTVNVSLSQMTLDTVRQLADRRFTFSVTGVAPQGFILQASTNLLGWVSVSTNALAGGRCNFTNADPSLGVYPRRFYRTQAVP